MTDTETNEGGSVATLTNPEPEIEAPELPVGLSTTTPEPTDVAVTTLDQPCPVQRDDTPGAPGDPTLVWVDGITPVGTGPEPPDEGTPATGAIAGTPGTFTPAGATPPADLAACASLTATPNAAWATGQHVVLGDATHAHWDGAAWAAGDAA